MESMYSWIPLYTELGRRLCEWENRQPELIACLNELRSKGVKVTPLNDRDRDGNRFLIKEMDPFTFFGTFNRQIKNEARITILTAIKKLLGATGPLPEDFDGIPTVNNQSSWFVGYQYVRKEDDVSKLWKVFRLAQRDDPLDDPEFARAFDEAIDVHGVNVNLTMGLFWIRPDCFLNLDKVNRDYLNIELPPKGLSAQFFANTVKTITANGTPLAKVSHDAWEASADTEKRPMAQRAESQKFDGNYWLVGSYWQNSDPPDQLTRFLEEGIWQNGYEDEYLDEVRSIAVGDRIGIKSSSTQKNNLPFDAHGNTVSKMTIKAIGIVVANRGDGRTIEVEWDPSFQAKDWYCYTDRRTIWRVRTDDDYELLDLSRRLVDFVWNDAEQDYVWFRKRWWDAEGRRGGVKSEEVLHTEAGKTSPYGIDDLISSGVFLERDDIEVALTRLRSKKNLILQGAPGVGKTFVARKLAYALMEEKATDRLEIVQFHQTYSYEDFVRGYRPLPESAGTFGLQDSVFFRFCKRAQQDPDQDYVFIIDEINRGNLSQIFGELLMLIEADKRGAEFAVPLVYQHKDEPRFFVPANVHLIGLMNQADRSLAIVDYALRRRFAFVTLKPQYASVQYRQWLLDRQMNRGLADLLIARMVELNSEISHHALLGENYQIGHSFFCPKGDDFSELDRDWYESIVRTEIIPLLREYWFDDSAKADQVAEALLAR